MASQAELSPEAEPRRNCRREALPEFIVESTMFELLECNTSTERGKPQMMADDGSTEIAAHGIVERGVAKLSLESITLHVDARPAYILKRDSARTSLLGVLYFRRFVLQGAA